MSNRPRIHIGNQTAFSAPSVLEPFDYAVQQGFDAFEWFPDRKPWGGWDDTNLDPAARLEIRRHAATHGIRLSVHARWQANPLQAEAWPVLWRDVALAEDLGAALLNIHLEAGQGIETYVRAITPLVQRVGELGLQLALENTPLTTPPHFNELFARLHALESVATSHVGMCFDLGHANLCAATRHDYLKYLDELGAHVPLIHLHVHENWGDHDSHLPLFTGPAGRDDAGVRGFIQRLRQRNYSGSVILEQWPQPPWLLNQARERFLALWHEGATAPANPQPVSVAVSLSTAEGAGGGVGINRTKSGALNPGTSERRFPNRLAATASGFPPIWKSALRFMGTGPSQSIDATVSSTADQDDFIQFLVSANQRAQSWREKLDFVRGFLADETRALTTGHLLDLAIYLRFLGTGEIPCAEDGRHFRPSHHAKISIQIQERLAQLHTPENGFILRKIYPWLPSSGAEFMRAEPLTRIRDLAHRNDIPSGLKRELKQTLQNKLHRCAGPEDLATSAALLTRLTAPGADYPAAFVEQFKVFHAELREFFNARSLDERLETLARTIPRRRRREETLAAEAPDLIHRFLAAKRRMNGDAETALAALRLLLELRRHLLTGLEMNSGVESQELLLADIGLEDFSFVLLSELNRALEAGRQSIPWAQLTEALALTLASLAFSGVETDECRALEAECHAWRASFDPRDREQLLRLKATADRARRLAEDFSDHLLALFPPRAEKLGRALGVAEHAVRQFCEGEIRAHVVFQLSKLVSGLSPPIRAAAALPHWDVLVGGRATGTLTAVDSLDGISVAAAGPLIALLRHAEGDEEIPSGVTGVILAHELPHLSHLAVRARQGGVVLVACEEAAKFHETARLAGQWVVLDATPDQVTVAVTAEPKTSPLNAAAPRRLRVPDVSLLQPAGSWLPLAQATPENAGGKAAGALRLAQISQRPNAGFKTPPGIVIPFGVMAHALRATPALEVDYGQWLRRLSAPDGLDAAAEHLRRLVLQLEVPAELSRIVAGQFGEGARLMVRSSANCEDLENLAGAGLYDSVANIAPADVASAVRAVWASLWTRRATLSRQQAGLPHARAHMAVLIQPMVAPDVSFILHTVNPINQNAREVYVELVAGLGETLASAATRGQPWRLICDKQSGQTTTLAFANFSEALWPNPAGGLARRRVNYSQMALSRDAASRPRLGARLAAIARTVEEGFGRPQDIEGVVAGEDIYLVQSRPQPGIE